MKIVGRLSDRVAKRVAHKTRLSKDVAWAATNLLVISFVTFCSLIAVIIWEPRDSIFTSYAALGLILLLIGIVVTLRFDNSDNF